MKRKILSLALALMMIISVAAAMPVSADVADIDLDAKTLNVDEGDTTTATVGTGTNAYGEDVSWVTNGAVEFRAPTSSATWTFDVVTPGSYDILVAAGHDLTSAGKALDIFIDGNPIEVDVVLNAYSTTDGLTKDELAYYPAETVVCKNLGLTAGTHTIQLANTYLLFVYNVKLVYSGDEVVIVDCLGATSTANGGASGLTFHRTTTPTTDVEWADKNAIDFFANGYADYQTYIPKEGTYKIYSASGTSASSKLSFIYDGTTVTGNLTNTGANGTAVENEIGEIVLPSGLISFRLKSAAGRQYNYNIKLVYQIPEPDKYTIKAAAEAGGTATANGAETATVEAGETVTLNATPDDGYAFIGWHDGTAIVDSNATYTVTVTETKTYTAKFQLTATVLNATEMTKSHSSGYHTTQTASSKNVSWAADTGYKMCTTSFVGVKGNVTIDEDGWYDVTVAYGTSRSDVLGVVDFGTSTGYSVDLQALLPTTGAHATCNAASLGSIYLTAGDYPINVYLKQKVSSGWYATIYSIKIDESEAPSVVNINGGRPTSGSSVEVSATMDWSNSGLPSWVNYGSARIDGPSQSYTYTAMVPATGYYTVKIAVGATANTSPRINFAVDGVPVVEEMYINSATSGSNGNLQDIGVTTLARVYLTGGSRTFTVSGVQNMHACRVYNILLVAEDLPEANTIRITDDDDNDVSYFAAGERVTAEVALDPSVEGANIFIVQYAGSGDEKIMVASTFTGAASSLAYSTEDYNFYRVKTTVVSGVTEIKAFVWKTDGSFAPLCAPVTLN